MWWLGLQMMGGIKRPWEILSQPSLARGHDRELKVPTLEPSVAAK